MENISLCSVKANLPGDRVSIGWQSRLGQGESTFFEDLRISVLGKEWTMLKCTDLKDFAYHNQEMQNWSIRYALKPCRP